MKIFHPKLNKTKLHLTQLQYFLFAQLTTKLIEKTFSVTKQGSTKRRKLEKKINIKCPQILLPAGSVMETLPAKGKLSTHSPFPPHSSHKAPFTCWLVGVYLAVLQLGFLQSKGLRKLLPGLDRGGVLLTDA